ncbi:MAG: response regulator [Gammaproteobacteria bacterium]|nr:response regulator [Gammaproteobacteria bacterium]
MENSKVLIVDDSRAACAVLTRILASFGIEADSVLSAAQAFEYLERKQPVLIFMDHLMPEMDGLQAITQIKKNPKWQSIPIYMFTARSDEPFIEKVKQSGALDIIPKSLDRATLKNALSRVHLLTEKSATATARAKAPNQKQQMQVWLESFIENKLAPALAYRVDKSARELREEILQNGDKLHRSSLQFHMKQEKHLVNQIQAERESLLSAYEYNQSRFFRKLGIGLSAVVAVFAVVVSGMYLDAESRAESLEQKIASLNNTQQILLAKLDRSSSSPEQYSSNNAQPRDLVDIDGNRVAEIIAQSNDFQNLEARTKAGYFISMTNLMIRPAPRPTYFLAQDCFGTQWVEGDVGRIYENQNGTLWFTPKEAKPELKTVFSQLDAAGDCIPAEGVKELVQLLPNDPDLTELASANLYLP